MNVVQDLSDEGQNVFKTIVSRLTINNLVKYIVQGIAVAVAAYVIPNRQTNFSEIMIISVIASLTFFVLDVFNDTDDIAKAVRLGTGFGIGMGLVNISQLPAYLSFL
jgi:ABC-type thiamin/hydroxymethylpyrimidine transport system permease subunit